MQSLLKVFTLNWMVEEYTALFFHFMGQVFTQYKKKIATEDFTFMLSNELLSMS